MAKKPVIGHMACPECDFADAEVREDKTGKAYRYCPECDAQMFSRTAAQDQRMRSRMRPVATDTPPGPPGPADPAPEVQPAPAPEVAQQPEPARRRVGLLME